MTGRLLPDAFYYLRNFRQAIDWVVERNADLLSQAERQFATQLSLLPEPAQALLARLLMRRGTLFRRSKIRYAEIEALDAALAALIEIDWVDPHPKLDLEALFRLATHAELADRFGSGVRRVSKSVALEMLREEHLSVSTFEQWLNTHESVYAVTVAPMALQFRLLHFGNFHQEWHEYTLAHLQIFKYEPVTLDHDSRPFDSRADIEFFYALHQCYDAFHGDAELMQVLALLPRTPPAQAWLRRRWDQLRYHIGQLAERQAQPDIALDLYRDNTCPDACVRQVRLLERLAPQEEALAAARAALSTSPSELIVQRMGRIITRLERRRSGQPGARAPKQPWPTVTLQLPLDPECRVEQRVQAHLSREEAPVYYVENSLIGSLFGLLCWEALFAPVRGAFFHAFQSAPADLGCPSFVPQRQGRFSACLKTLDSGEHAEKILKTFAEKYGTSAPFVHWQALDETILQLALQCIAARHLRLLFARLLEDLTENCTGLPDLVQFFPAERRYKFIEVKGPGDRLQDNQRRWLQYCTRHELPVEVCHVTWA
jgi:tetratricopeptide (TPR) repeat protein